ncbi:MAG: LysR family transcriptional regulator [Brevibacterium aurantiacum]
MIDRRLQVLRVLAEVGTLTEAAHRLGYTPSAVSHQLRSLSKDLGLTILEQRGRGLVLTRVGQLLLERTQELFTRWEEIRANSPRRTRAVRCAKDACACAASQPRRQLCFRRLRRR